MNLPPKVVVTFGQILVTEENQPGSIQKQQNPPGRDCSQSSNNPAHNFVL